MSVVTKEEIRSLGRLARLRLEDEEVESLQSDLSGILDHMELLAEVDTSGVEPMTHVTSKVQPLRPDQVRESLDRERVLSACHRSEDECFAVPSILPTGESQ
jgi:aspartyl-tRNA(Asn)/glutamyl-tRNA(Gln) amidotransferase subunit C